MWFFRLFLQCLIQGIQWPVAVATQTTTTTAEPTRRHNASPYFNPFNINLVWLTWLTSFQLPLLCWHQWTNGCVSLLLRKSSPSLSATWPKRRNCGVGQQWWYKLFQNGCHFAEMRETIWNKKRNTVWNAASLYGNFCFLMWLCCLMRRQLEQAV